MRAAKISLGIWSTLAREEQSCHAARAVEAMLARELFDKTALARYVERAFEANSPLQSTLRLAASN